MMAERELVHAQFVARVRERAAPHFRAQRARIRLLALLEYDFADFGADDVVGDGEGIAHLLHAA